jgi:drug/metabolite transporter (DMT)-like permease
MPNPSEDLGFPAWAYAFAGLFVYLAGVALCYGITAFVTFTFYPGDWGGIGRFVAVVLCCAWTAYFLQNVGEDDAGEE